MAQFPELGLWKELQEGQGVHGKLHEMQAITAVNQDKIRSRIWASGTGKAMAGKFF